jgi:hypothetical protein
LQRLPLMALRKLIGTSAITGADFVIDGGLVESL